MWLQGFAGCGKTVLSTTVLDHLTKQNDRLLLSFFFDFSDATKQSVDGILRSLAFQLYQGGAGSLVLDSLFQSRQGDRQQPSTKSLKDVTLKMLTSHARVFIILDALDESTTRNELLSWINDINSQPELGHVQLLCTGRPEAEFLRDLRPAIGEGNCLALDKQAINSDIGIHVASQLSNRREFREKQLSQDLLDRIQKKVGDGADGMFRWAACQLDSLAGCPSPKAIKMALDRLPRDLNETYQRMLDGIPRGIRNSSMRLLQFLLHAHRPLTVVEAVEILATDVEAEPPCFDVDGRVFGDEYVLWHGPSLMSIVEVTEHGGTIRKELHLAHFSVKEFLQCQVEFDRQKASVVITMTSLTYLRDITGGHDDIIRDFPWAQFAAEIWVKHGASAEAHEDACRVILAFLQDERTFQRWGRLHQADQAWNKNPGPPRGSRLYYICLNGLVVVAQALINMGVDVNAQGGEYSSALQAALSRGFANIIRLLLEKGADANA